MMKKYVRILVLTMVVTSMLGSTIFATENNNYDPNSVVVTQDYLSTEEYEEVLKKIDEKAKDSITPGLINKVKQIRKVLSKNKGNNDSSDVSIQASYDSVSLEALLCSNDGLSVLDIHAIGWTHANAARNEAIELYTDTLTEMKRDAFRHMTWNFRSIKDVGEHKTSVATINHEWAYKILPAVNRYETNTYNSLLDEYQLEIAMGLKTTWDIQMMAKALSDAYAITYRDGLAESCKNDLLVFNSTFDMNAYIMDFWNNKVGRDYGKSNPSSSTNTVFIMAWDGKKLIKNETSSQVTPIVRSVLHQSNSWYNQLAQ